VEEIRMRFRDQLSGLFWLAVSIVVVYIEATQDNIGTIGRPGPGFLPFWSGVVLGVFSIILIVKKSLTRGDGEKLRASWAGKKWGSVILALISLLIYVALLDKVGFIITTFGLMYILFGIIGKRRPWIQGMGALLAALVSYFVFTAWLDVQLPKGLFCF
jgi:putative tricarboxylic transport membrane protein